VLRDRLSELEDRFFATVFLGSGLLFLAMLFGSAAVAGGIIITYSAKPEGLLDSATFTFARALTYEIMNLYAVKMVGVFIISTSTLAVRTGFPPPVCLSMSVHISRMSAPESKKIESPARLTLSYRNPTATGHAHAPGIRGAPPCRLWQAK
jgi:hypothetical protein